MRNHTVLNLKERLSRLRTSKKIYIFLCAAVFLLMAVLNFLTPKCVDDFSYMFSLVDNHRIASIGDIFSSLYVHASVMNGRLAAHFFVYLFDMLPKPVFNIVNSLFFLALTLLLSRFSAGSDNNYNKNKQKDPLLFVLLFCALWCFEYDFGQVNLWLTGSCNYLWALVFSLLYILPFYKLYCRNSVIFRPLYKFLFLLFSLLCGAYNEVASSSMIFIAVLFIVLTLLDKRKIPVILYVSLIFACLGFLSMFLAPAQSAKSGLSQPFSDRLLLAVKMYSGYLPLIFLWLFLFVLSVNGRRNRNRNRDRDSDKNKDLIGIFSPCPAVISAVFMAGSLCANFILVFAGSYAGRCAAPALIWLLAALSVLFPVLSASCSSKYLKYFKRVPVILFLLILPFTAYYGIFGCYDVYRTGRDMRENLATVEKARDSGTSTVELSLVYPATKYSAIYNLKYLDTDTPDTWPNESIAFYYGLVSVIGVP